MIYKSQTSNDLQVAVNSAAMSEHLLRVGKLKQIQRDRSWSDAELARQCERTPQQVLAWFRFPAKGGRRIGEKLARDLENKLKLAPYALDERDTNEAVPQASILQARDHEAQYGKAESTEPGPANNAFQEGTAVPVLSWRDLPVLLTMENTAVPKTVNKLDTFARITRYAKFVEMPDDSMAPEFFPGDHILFEPAEAPHAGDTVLVRIPSGEHFVRTFRPRSAHNWDATPINDHYQPLLSTRDAVEVVAVMIEHRRYRRKA